ncbi:MAG: tRNA (N6-threonylcarbamoyladenosine(37)-N6)-methyltransferase TrmO [Proteobacteria bacterium]|nr:tRNA (N6-threonylcarbamoyladenosine(37)-N6)-methyltransferase TrmO [Pseudomonadota bacterium]
MNTTEHSPIVCRPIGRIHSRFTAAEGMPIQTTGAPAEPGSIEVYPEFEPGLRDIEGFDYLIVLTHLHAVQREMLEVVPFLDNQPHGVFATRAPARPNRIGLSIVRLVRREGGVLHFEGNDMLDGTPIIDIKPYVPRFDVRETTRIGWFEAKVDRVGQVLSDARMSPAADGPNTPRG